MRPQKGIVCDAAHSEKKQITEYQGFVLETGEKIFYHEIGYQTTNIGEFLALVDSIKWVIENDYFPKVIYSDSVTAIAWVREMRTASKKKNKDLYKAEIFLQVFEEAIKDIEIIHWNSKIWGENPADFGNK